MRRPLLFLLLLLSGVAHAHEVRPAYFEIVERQDGSYSLTWKQPPLAEARVAIEPQLPATCTPLGERLKQKSPVITAWCGIPEPWIAALMARASAMRSSPS